MTSSGRGNSRFLTRVVLNNYKSIKECSVRLGSLNFLVGRNGAGKSNFLDALRFVSDSLNTSLEHALRNRGGIKEVRRRSSGHPTHFGIRLEWRLPNETMGFYSFRIGAKPNEGFEVQREECRVFRRDPLKEEIFYKVENGAVSASEGLVTPPAAPDRLYLVAASGLPPFRPLYDALSRMGFYNFNPDVIRELQPPDPGEVLKRDGSNLASVLDALARRSPDLHGRVVDFLSKAVPGIEKIEVKHLGKKTTLEFRQQVGTNKDPWRFLTENMSDGTLRALGVLTAVFHAAADGEKPVPFVGIEEPEVAVHPGAAGVLRDALIAASRRTQTAVTSHSPDLLDDKEITDEAILAVVNRSGETRIGPLDPAGRSAVRDRLYTVGELLRLNQIDPDEEALSATSAQQLDLFADFEP